MGEDERRRTWASLDFLVKLATAMLESGYATDPMTQTVRLCGAAMGLERITVVGIGRTVTLEYLCADGQALTRTAAASTIDAFDCDRMKRLKNVAREVTLSGTDPDTARRMLADAERGPLPWPWWFLPFGGSLLALCIALQVGGTAKAAVAAAVVLPPVYALGRGLGRLAIPRLYGVAVQTAFAAALGGLLHVAGAITLTDTAVLIATNWVLLVPMPQLVSTAIDAVSSDGVAALARAASALLVVGGITLGGALVLAFSQRFSFGDPIDPTLPQLSLRLAIGFSILGALGNAVFNGGGRDLLLPAAGAGLLTAAVNQTLIHAGNMPSEWSGPIAAAALGFAAAACSDLLRLPMTALALVGITGALLPGLIVYQGLVIELFHTSGVGYFVRAFAVCVGLGVGAALGVILYVLFRRIPLPRRRAGG
ncbi:threonine/serine exporter family protein [Nocardia puris]|uniref:threonine/serine exporter family protein n=1 Tax=Nocardia puris TaxID=208602 RepID=UPI001893F179|nr:threonine/serine exporter family protein [Nocardia puris]MBF6214503.1 threonine/serine exporter family protein [Nocardia puris]MBF6365912.1 threonine/serine exporter family protein [Nocardia puris]MBF6460445.1 threonine/serine exporter family protein [Nocardia puris]